MKRLPILLPLLLLLLIGCSPSNALEGDPETLLVTDRSTGTIYHPDPHPQLSVEPGGRITFTENGTAYILQGNWLISAKLKREEEK